MKCTHCGAMIDPGALACPYCKVTTPAGVAARAQEQHAAQVHAQHVTYMKFQSDLAARQRVDALGRQSVVFGGIGLVLCCTPLSIAGIVQAVRSRSLASSIQAPAPTQAMVGLVLNILGIIAFIGAFITAAISGSEAKSENERRIAILEQQVGTKTSDRTLAPATACTLAEIYARKSGFDGKNGQYLTDFDCNGALTYGAEKAEMPSYRFKNNGTAYDVHVCLVHASKWYVSDLRRTSCPK